MTRAMTLIKMYFIGTFKAITTDVQKRLATQDVSQVAQMHLLYAKFHSGSAQLAPLLAELERRAAAYPDELVSLLGECHASYLTARKGLITGRLVEEIRALDPGRSDLVELVSWFDLRCMAFT